MAKVINGKDISASFRDSMKEALTKVTRRRAGLAVIIVGDDPASKVYVANKVKGCEYIGINSYKYELSADVSEKELLELIDKLNKDNNIDGILTQLPLPAHLDEKKILNTIDFSKDVDGFGIESAGLLSIGTPGYVSCTPQGIIKMLEYEGIDISGKDAVIIGRSNIVGKPMAQLLMLNNATIAICHSRTKDISSYTKRADIIVAAVGIPKFLKANMVKDGAVVIDVGINRVDGKLVGDVDFEEVEKVAGYITPVPGGVGPMTITMLMYNTIKAYEIHERIEIPLSF